MPRSTPIRERLIWLDLTDQAEASTVTVGTRHIARLRDHHGQSTEDEKWFRRGSHECISAVSGSVFERLDAKTLKGDQVTRVASRNGFVLVNDRDNPVILTTRINEVTDFSLRWVIDPEV